MREVQETSDDGNGAKPEDVVIDLAKDKKAKLHGPSDPLKEVGIRVDRADGFVFRNVTAAHAAEHGIYIRAAGFTPPGE